MHDTKPWQVVLGAILVQFALGGVYAWSVFTPLLREAGWTTSQTQNVFSLAIGCIPLGMLLGGLLIDRLGPSLQAKLSGCIVGAAYLLAGLSGGTSYTLLCICLGVVYGLGIGIGYLVPLSVCVNRFPHRRGLFAGVAAFGFGLGVMVWVKLAGSWGGLLESLGLSRTFMVYGLLIGAMVFTGSRWMRYPSTTDGERHDAEDGPEAHAELSRRDMLRTLRFHVMFLTYTFSAAGGLMAMGLMKLYPIEALQQGGLSPAEASAVAGTAIAVFFSLANALGRLAWGGISDRIGRRGAVILMALGQAVCLSAFPFMAGSPVLLTIGAALIGFHFGANFALFPALTADAFGPANVGRNYPLVNLAYGAGGLIGPTIGGWYGDVGEYGLAFTISGLLCGAGGLLALFLLRLPSSRTPTMEPRT